jgi:hypothetical protein
VNDRILVVAGHDTASHHHSDSRAG